MRHWVISGAVLAGALALTGPSRAEMQAPLGEVVLTVDGGIGADGAPFEARFDIDMLAALPQVEFDTTTLWTEGVTRFTGVPLKAVLDHLGATGQTVEARALNDYSVQIPVADLEDDAPIIAYKMNGATFSRRERGPLWVVYPFDRDDRYRTEVAYGQSIWQLVRLTVRN